MTTTYQDRDWVYSASLNDGVTSGNITVQIPYGTPVSDATMDAAISEFLGVINASITITSTQKQRSATGASDWTWIP